MPPRSEKVTVAVFGLVNLLLVPFTARRGAQR